VPRWSLPPTISGEIALRQLHRRRLKKESRNIFGKKYAFLIRHEVANKQYKQKNLSEK